MAWIFNIVRAYGRIAGLGMCVRTTSFGIAYYSLAVEV